MLEVKHLTKKYGKHTAVSDLNFTLNEGEVVGLLGLNGMGKSTTLNMITGYSAPTAGEVYFDGVSMAQNSLEVRRNIGYLPEIPPLYQDFTAVEHLRFVCTARSIAAAEIPAEIDRVCKLANIDHLKGKLIRNLSKGYRQRVGIASALVGDPKFIVLDEPTVGLDPLQLIEVRKLILDLAKRHTIIISSHILGEVFSICTRLLVLTNGHLMADLTKDAFLAQCISYETISLQILDTQTDLTDLLLSQNAIKSCVRKPDLPNHIAEYQLTLCTPDEPGTDLFDLLCNHHIPTVAIAPQQTSLEDVFMELASPASGITREKTLP